MKRLISMVMAAVFLFTAVSCQNTKDVAVFNPVPQVVTPTVTPEPAKSTVPSTLPSNDTEKTSIPALSPKPTPTPIHTNNPNLITTPVPPTANTTPDIIDLEKYKIPQECQQLPYFYSDRHERYVRYKALNPELDYEKAIVYVNIGLDNPFYTGIREISEPHRINVLVNKYNKLPSDYKPKLEEIPPSLCSPGVGKQYLRKEAKDAFEKMHMDAKKLGLNITAYGTYRSIQTQDAIWNRKVSSGKSIEEVDRLNSRGGHSEHHTGLALDVIKNDYSVEKTKEFEWYKENAHKYGFIIRYPKGKESITGYSYEPWHLRYVGVELATEVYESGLSYEEYYAMKIEPYIN